VNSWNSVLEQLGFSEGQLVAGRSTIADLFPKTNKRSGVYILHFENNEIYVGQAKDVVRRFAEHRRRWNDIRCISFQQLKIEDLSSVEQNSIFAAEQSGLHVRNIQYAAMPSINSDFDLIMSIEQQNSWLYDIRFVDIEGDRIMNESFRKKYHDKYLKMSSMPFAAEIKQTLRNYIRKTIPAIKRAEVAHWVCTCLPARIVYSRVNCGMQVVFQIGVRDGEVLTNFHISRQSANVMAANALHAGIERINTKFCGVDAIIVANDLSSGGLDQVQIAVRGHENIRQVLNDLNYLKAARLFNLNLMRKRTSGWQRNHCLDLADCVYE
jgi:hypothetical protein